VDAADLHPAAEEEGHPRLDVADADDPSLAAVAEAERQRLDAADADDPSLAVVEAERQHLDAADADDPSLAVVEAERQHLDAADVEARNPGELDANGPAHGTMVGRDTNGPSSCQIGR